MRARLAIAVVAAVSASALAQDGSRSLRTANGMLQRGLYDQAASEYADALRALDEPAARDEARYGLAVARFNLGQNRQALEALDRLERGSRFEFRADADVLRLHVLMRLKDYARAADAADTAVRHRDHAAWPGTASLRIEALARAGRHAQAVQAYSSHAERIAEDNAAFRRASFFAGISQNAQARRTADHARAAEWFERAIPRRGVDELASLAMLERANALRRADLEEEAIGAYQRTMSQGSERVRPDAMLALGSLLRTRGQSDAAADLLTTLADQHPRHEPDITQYELGLALLDDDRPREASRALDRAERSADDALQDDIAYWRAKADLRRDRPAESAERLKSALDEHRRSPLRAEMRYDLAVALQRGGETEAAADAFATYLHDHGDHAMAADALYAQASLTLEAGDTDAAAALADRFIESFPRHQLNPGARFIRGESAYRAGDHESAAGDFATLVDSADAQLAERARYRLGMSLHALGRSDDAMKHLRAVVGGPQTQPEFRPALFTLADIAFEDSRWPEAERGYGQYIEAAGRSGPQSESATFKLALSRLRQNNLDSGIEALQQVLSSWPQGRHAAHAGFELGQALVLMGEDAQADRVLQRLIAQHGESRFAPHAYRHLAAIASRQGDAERAADLYSLAASTGGNDMARSIAVDRARVLLNADRPNDAADILRGMPGVAQAWRVIALSRAGNHEDATELSDDFEVDEIGFDTNTRAIYDYALARSLIELSRETEAEPSLARAARSESPTAPFAALDLAELQLQRNQFAEAASLLEPFAAATDIDDSVRASAAYKAAWSRYQLGEHRAVVSLLDNRDLGTLAGPGAMLLGESLLALKRSKEAAAQFDIALRDQSTEVDSDAALLRLGEAHAAAQDWRQSQQAYERHRREHPRSPRWYMAEFGIGWALENGKNQREAIAHYRTVADKHKGETAARAQFQLGECLFALGEHEEAVRELLRVDILHAAPKWSAAALYEAGRCFEAMSKIGEARAQYREVRERFPESPWATAAGERLAAIAGPGGTRTSERGG
ncbi:MAG: tetratricopeptide repeat protein [Planctomycetota bacterium]